MVKVIADESVVGGEVCQNNILVLQAYRIKTANGRYVVVLASSEADAIAFAKKAS
jgi:hypothetical protein